MTYKGIPIKYSEQLDNPPAETRPFRNAPYFIKPLPWEPAHERLIALFVACGNSFATAWPKRE